MPNRAAASTTLVPSSIQPRLTRLSEARISEAATAPTADIITTRPAVAASALNTSCTKPGTSCWKGMPSAETANERPSTSRRVGCLAMYRKPPAMSEPASRQPPARPCAWAGTSGIFSIVRIAIT